MAMADAETPKPPDPFAFARRILADVERDYRPGCELYRVDARALLALKVAEAAEILARHESAEAKLAAFAERWNAAAGVFAGERAARGYEAGGRVMRGEAEAVDPMEDREDWLRYSLEVAVSTKSRVHLTWADHLQSLPTEGYVERSPEGLWFLTECEWGKIGITQEGKLADVLRHVSYIDEAEPEQFERTRYWVAESEDAERYQGPFLDQDEAREHIRAECDPGLWLIFEGKQKRLHLSRGIDAVDIAERASERAHDNGEGDPDGDPVFELTVEQDRSLEAALSAAADAWEREQGLEWWSWSVDRIGDFELVEKVDGRVVGLAIEEDRRAAIGQALTGGELKPKAEAGQANDDVPEVNEFVVGEVMSSRTDLPKFPDIGCAGECGFVVAGLGYECRDGTACGRYIHPGDKHFAGVDAYHKAMTRIAYPWVKTMSRAGAQTYPAGPDAGSLRKPEPKYDEQSQRTVVGKTTWDAEAIEATLERAESEQRQVRATLSGHNPSVVVGVPVCILVRVVDTGEVVEQRWTFRGWSQGSFRIGLARIGEPGIIAAEIIDEPAAEPSLIETAQGAVDPERGREHHVSREGGPDRTEAEARAVARGLYSLRLKKAAAATMLVLDDGDSGELSEPDPLAGWEVSEGDVRVSVTYAGTGVSCDRANVDDPYMSVIRARALGRACCPVADMLTYLRTGAAVTAEDGMKITQGSDPTMVRVREGYGSRDEGEAPRDVIVAVLRRAGYEVVLAESKPADPEPKPEPWAAPPGWMREGAKLIRTSGPGVASCVISENWIDFIDSDSLVAAVAYPSLVRSYLGARTTWRDGDEGIFPVDDTTACVVDGLKRCVLIEDSVLSSQIAWLDREGGR